MKQNWFVQGNPKHFKIDKYLIDRGCKVVWRIGQAKNFEKGDNVFIWRSRASRKKDYCGILAHGKVVEVSSFKSLHKKYEREIGDKYWIKDKSKKLKKPKKSNKQYTGVFIRLDSKLKEIPEIAPLSKPFLEELGLGGLNIIKSAQGDYKSISEKEYQKLCKLWKKITARMGL